MAECKGIYILTDASSTKMDGNFFSVAITTPLAAAFIHLDTCKLKHYKNYTTYNRAKRTKED